MLLVSILGGACRAAAAPPTEAVFRRFADAVVQIRVTEKGSGAKAVIGSGFFADHAGRMVTNYHVVSKLVLHPDRYVAERVDHLGGAEMVHIGIRFDAALRPLPRAWIPGGSVEAILAEVPKLENEVRRLATQQPRAAAWLAGLEEGDSERGSQRNERRARALAVR